jgi:UDP-2-acetamido-2-deoxy-ribo-hexuluronate aminotransferase
MKVSFYTSVREYIEKKNEFDSAVAEIMSKGNYILGEEVGLFEKAVAEYTAAKYAVAVASGSDALVIASDILGFKDGREVITSPFTFFASTSCIVRNGAKPVFVDIDESTFNINTDLIEEHISNKTVGILPIHLFSQMADMDYIKEIADKYSLKILEDAAEAFGMRWKGRGDDYKHAGTIGDFGIFSFFPTKTLGAYGDGGMMITNDENLYQLAKMYRVHGASKKYHHDYIGYNSRLDTIQAAILMVKLKHLEDSIKKREKVASWYIERLRQCNYIKLPQVKGDQKQVYYVFNILAENRDSLIEYLRKKEIQTAVYYPVPLHLQKCFKYLGYKKGDFPVSEKVSEQILALPIYPELTGDEVDYICENILAFYRDGSNN